MGVQRGRIESVAVDLVRRCAYGNATLVAGWTEHRARFTGDRKTRAVHCEQRWREGEDVADASRRGLRSLLVARWQVDLFQLGRELTAANFQNSGERRPGDATHQ